MTVELVRGSPVRDARSLDFRWRLPDARLLVACGSASVVDQARRLADADCHAGDPRPRRSLDRILTLSLRLGNRRSRGG
jgi:hypothetical protein